MTDYPIARAVAVDAGVDRVLVGGMDLNDFRTDDATFTPIKVPGYTLIEPFGYGSSQPLVIPRTNSNFEWYGHGELAWLKKGAQVKYQRVYESGTVTDYRGFITSIETTGREFVCQVAGELAGRAALVDKPPVKIRKVYDIASLMRNAMDTFGFVLDPPLADTNIHAPNQGGMTWLSWFQTLCAYSRTNAANQRSLMPTTWGGRAWSFAQKDTTTVDCTIFADGQRIQLNLVDDVAEQPTTVYGSGVTADGERWDGSVYPGYIQGPPAPYPFDDTSTTFGLNTTDEDTDTQDGITVMVKMLCWHNLLSDSLFELSTYTQAVADAVDRLKDMAGLPENGTMTYEAWKALWDIDIVGYSSQGARIMPLVEVARARSWNYSPTGSIIGRNPARQYGVVRVSRTVDFGVCDEDQARRWAKTIVHPYNDHDWAGTIVLNNISVFAGERDEAYAATGGDPDDVLPARSIRPGMNVWLPYFDSGTLLHISGVDVSGTTVTLTVSSAALDVFDITQAMQRNRDASRNIYREWRIANRGARPSNHFISRDKHFGRLYQNISLTGGQWNVVPVVMGQSGTVSRTDIRLVDDECEFIFAVFDKKVTPTGLQAKVGNPFSLDSEGRPPWEHTNAADYFEDRDLCIVEGRGDQPCGYSWRPGYNAEGDRISGNPLTGTFVSEATWSYFTDPNGDPVCYVAIYPESDCTLQRGRLFYALEDDPT